jgi:hypothetical protein
VQRDEADLQLVHRGEEAGGLGEGGAHLSPDELAPRATVQADHEREDPGAPA